MTESLLTAHSFEKQIELCKKLLLCRCSFLQPRLNDRPVLKSTSKNSIALCEASSSFMYIELAIGSMTYRCLNIFLGVPRINAGPLVPYSGKQITQTIVLTFLIDELSVNSSSFPKGRVKHYLLDSIESQGLG